jgi:hypothetical protein
MKNWLLFTPFKGKENRENVVILPICAVKKRERGLTVTTQLGQWAIHLCN